MTPIRRYVGAALVLMLLFVTAQAQNLTKAEYFFDVDPGQGNGVNLPMSPGPNVTFTANVPVAALPVGFHFLGLRVKENGGPWSLFEGRGFYISSIPSNTTDIARAEYFIDSDPGQGNGTAVAVPQGPNLTFVFTVPTASLSNGFHFLALRVRDSSGRWSLFEARGFFITTTTANAPDIVGGEYFFDVDPGQGNGTPIALTPGASVTATVPIPTPTLSTGFHFLAIRTKGSNGQWGHFEARGFYVSGSVASAPAIGGAEYFFDNDPGVGQATPLTVPGGDIANFTVDLPTAGLTPGFHFLTIRTRDTEGKWGQFESRGFYVYPQSPASGNIVAAEYFIDSDPGQGRAIAAAVTNPALDINQLFPLTISGISAGTHQLGFRVQDSEGVWSEPKLSAFSVLNCTPPTPPVAPSITRCNAGSVSLQATGAASGQEYRWYAAEFGGPILFSGSGFTTPALTVSTDYFVSVYDPVTTCESARTRTSAQVLPVVKPVLNATGTLTLCEGTGFVLSAPAGFVSYTWSDGSTTQQVLVTRSGKYTVSVNNGSCDLPMSDEVVFNFLPAPATPTIAVEGSAAICNSGTVTLRGPADAGSYLWSNGETTPSITVSTAGAYRLAVKNAAGCASQSSVAVDIDVFTTPATPVVTVTGLTELCSDSFSVLSAPSGFGHYLWSGGETTQTIIVRNTGNYSVQVGNAATCLSASSSTVAITSTGKPCSTPSTKPNNSPPEIDYVELTAAVRGRATLDLASIISDDDGEDDIDFASVKVVGVPTSKAVVSIIDKVLHVDYSQTDFTGADVLVLQVCDVSLSCTQQDIHIEVAGEITAYNAVSPNGDGLNEFLYLEFIDVLPGTGSNKVTIFNRWGSEVLAITNYDNADRVFRGVDASGRELPNGTYFYRIEFDSDKARKEGFITLRR